MYEQTRLSVKRHTRCEYLHQATSPSHHQQTLPDILAHTREGTEKQRRQFYAELYEAKTDPLVSIRCIYYAQNKLILASWHHPRATFHKLLMYSVPRFAFVCYIRANMGSCPTVFSPHSSLSLFNLVLCLVQFISWSLKKKNIIQRE